MTNSQTISRQIDRGPWANSRLEGCGEIWRNFPSPVDAFGCVSWVKNARLAMSASRLLPLR